MRLLARWQSATATAEAAAAPAAATAGKSGPGSGIVLVGALALLGGYIWHSREGNIAHDALVEQLAAEAVLCPNEVTALRSKNKVTYAVARWPPLSATDPVDLFSGMKLSARLCLAATSISRKAPLLSLSSLGFCTTR